MEKRKQRSRQVDLFARDPNRLQWQGLSPQQHHQTQMLLAYLTSDIVSQIFKGQKSKEVDHV